MGDSRHPFLLLSVDPITNKLLCCKAYLLFKSTATIIKFHTIS